MCVSTCCSRWLWNGMLTCMSPLSVGQVRRQHCRENSAIFGENGKTIKLWCRYFELYYAFLTKLYLSKTSNPASLIALFFAYNFFIECYYLLISHYCINYQCINYLIHYQWWKLRKLLTTGFLKPLEMRHEMVKYFNIFNTFSSLQLCTSGKLKKVPSQV